MADPFIAEVVIFAGNFAPRQWAFCDGQLLPISNNTALFSLIGTIYGGDGRTTMALPDLRGRVAIGPRTGPGLSTYREGEKGGTQSVTLTTSQIPSHNHIINADKTLGTSTNPANNFMAIDSGTDKIYSTSVTAPTTMNANAVGHTGGNLSHENRQPYLAINYVIALFGIFPSRN